MMIDDHLMMMNDDFNDMSVGTICSISIGWGNEHTFLSEPIIDYYQYTNKERP